MIKLEAKFGYLIHNKITDTYSRLIYLPDGVNLDNFEEVEDDTVDKKLRVKMEEIERKEQSLTKVAKVVANSVTDDVVALEIQEFYDIWQVGVSYTAGQYIRHNDILYKVLTSHTSQADWSPDISPSLFANVLTSLDGTPQEWIQPDSTNAYMTGDKVIFEGQIYESLIDNNIWSPSAYPAGWKLIEES